MEVATIATNTPAANRTPEQRGVYRRHHGALRDTQPLQFAMDVDTPDDTRHWIKEWSWNPIGMLLPIHEKDQGRLNEDNLDVWLWYRGIVPKTHNGLFERIVWHEIFPNPGKICYARGNPQATHPPLSSAKRLPCGQTLGLARRHHPRCGPSRTHHTLAVDISQRHHRQGPVLAGALCPTPRIGAVT